MELTYEQELIKAGKKVHLRKRIKSPFFGWTVRTACKVDSRTYAYAATTVESEVTCLRCKKTRPELINSGDENESSFY